MIKVAIVGIGNCASSLVQGVHYYRKNQSSAGLIIPQIFGFFVRDIEFVAAFDVDTRKVGCPLEEAIFKGQNNTLSFFRPQSSSCVVSSAPRFDGVGEVYGEQIEVVTGSDSDVHRVLDVSKPDVLVNYLPVGSDQGTKYWASLCIEMGIGFVNAIPSFVVSEPEWGSKFSNAHVPCTGDDVKSQIGATIVHRALVRIFEGRGGTIDNTYQLNFGGNMDFLNMLEGKRLTSKRISKTNSVVSQISRGGEVDIHISPTDYIKYLRDNKIAYINLKGAGFGGAPIEIETKMSVWDSPNSAAVVVDAIRFTAGAKKEGIGGPLPICDFYFKSPPEQRGDVEAEQKARQYAEKGSFL
jgi:myo-inositol-1-phosphate synthase